MYLWLKHSNMLHINNQNWNCRQHYTSSLHCKSFRELYINRAVKGIVWTNQLFLHITCVQHYNSTEAQTFQSSSVDVDPLNVPTTYRPTPSWWPLWNKITSKSHIYNSLSLLLSKHEHVIPRRISLITWEMFITFLWLRHNSNTINSRFHRFPRIYYFYINDEVFDPYTHLELEIRSNILPLW